MGVAEDAQARAPDADGGGRARIIGFAGELDGQVVACGAALRYDDRFAFCGFSDGDKPYDCTCLSKSLLIT